ncbi:MAG: ribonuclease HI [Myxococcales bacterium]|nr:MAG: ribonuclease HI [Myxococcales bacterium]
MTGLSADEVKIYTDGACSGNPGPCGVGVLLMEGELVKELSEYLGQGTNNIAELTAILRAAEALAGSTKTVRIYSDSQYAIGVLSKNWKAKANQELVAKTKLALGKLSHVELHYVRGHSGDPHNERADELAVQAVQTQQTTGWK